MTNTPIRESLAKEYGWMHLSITLAISVVIIPAILLGVSTVLGKEFFWGWDLISPMLAIAIVCIAYAAPLVAGKKTVPLSYLPEADTKLRWFALVGFVAMLASPLMFPRGSLETDAATTGALAAMGIAAILVIPLGIAIHTTLILVARRVRPITQANQR